MLYLATVGEAGKVRIWQSDTGKCLAQLAADVGLAGDREGCPVTASGGMGDGNEEHIANNELMSIQVSNDSDPHNSYL